MSLIKGWQTAVETPRQAAQDDDPWVKTRVDGLEQVSPATRSAPNPQEPDALLAFASEEESPGRPETANPWIRIPPPLAAAWKPAGILALVGAATAAAVVLLQIAFPVAVKPPPAPPQPRPSKVTISSRPAGAQVVIDGRREGITPLTLPINPGAHSMTIRLKGKERVIPLSVAEGSEVTHYLELPVAEDTARKQSAVAKSSAIGGWLALETPFDVQVVEGRETIGTSGTTKMMLPAGRHDVLLVNRTLDFRERRRIDVIAEKTTTVRVVAPKAGLSVNARPWADISIDGNSAGQTPIANLSVPIGAHVVTFRHPQFGERQETVVVTTTGPNRIAVDLTK